MEFEQEEIYRLRRENIELQAKMDRIVDKVVALMDEMNRVVEAFRSIKL